MGQVDVKTTPVHFYVQRSSVFNSVDKTITFDKVVLNIGNAMDNATGEFKAPVHFYLFFSIYYDFFLFSKPSSSSSNEFDNIFN